MGFVRGVFSIVVYCLWIVPGFVMVAFRFDGVAQSSFKMVRLFTSTFLNDNPAQATSLFVAPLLVCA